MIMMGDGTVIPYVHPGGTLSGPSRAHAHNAVQERINSYQLLVHFLKFLLHRDP